MTERSDLARYENGKYLGHVYRELRARIDPGTAGGGGSAGDGAIPYSGEFYVLEETTRDLSQAARPVDAVIPVSFKVYPDGRLDVQRDRGYPSLRGFPAFPSTPVRPGSTWTAKGTMAVDPRQTGTPIVIPLIAQYEYRGEEDYKGERVHHIVAKYATRYSDPGSSGKKLAGAQGTHDVDILLRTDDCVPLLLRDRLDETFRFGDGATLRFRGFSLTFSESFLPLDKDATAARLRTALATQRGTDSPNPQASPGPGTETTAQGQAGGGGTGAEAAESDTPGAEGIPLKAGSEDLLGSGDSFDLASAVAGGISGTEGAGSVDVEKTDTGVKLTLRDLRFAADSSELLPSEYGRLDLIASALLQGGDRSILVEGHTASVGRPSGEMELSKERAQRIVAELVKRGIPQTKLLYAAYGGTRPVASNDSEAGRARNRRVEITILE